MLKPVIVCQAVKPYPKPDKAPGIAPAPRPVVPPITAPVAVDPPIRGKAILLPVPANIPIELPNKLNKTSPGSVPNIFNCSATVPAAWYLSQVSEVSKPFW